MFGYVYNGGYYWRILGSGRYIIPDLAILTPTQWVIFNRSNDEETKESWQ